MAVANKVQTLDGRWLSIDGRVLFKANVAASETYNTALEQHLRESLGVRFAERPGTDPGKAADPRDRRRRPATEPALVDPPRPHQHPPRRAGHPVPGTITAAHRHRSKRCTWPIRRPWKPAILNTNHDPWPSNAQPGSNEAADVLGSPEAVAAMVRTALTPPAETTTIADARWVAQTASRVVAVMEQNRSTWQIWHVRAEAQRQVRTIDVTSAQATALVDLLVDEVRTRQSIPLAAPPDGIEEPDVMRRADGSSVYTIAGADSLHLAADPGRRDTASSPRPDDATGQPSTCRGGSGVAGDGGERHRT